MIGLPSDHRASHEYKPWEYFRSSVLAKSFEKSSEQSEDNSVDISRKDLGGHEPLVDESSRESRWTRKNVEEDLTREKSNKSQPKTQAQGKLNLPPFSIIAIALGTRLCM